MKIVNNFTIGEDNNVLISENVEIKGYYNVKEYGVVGDGLTNDALAIQALVDSIDNGTLYFPKGDYFIGNDSITIKSNINLIGDNATIKFNNTAIITADTFQVTTPNDIAIKTSNVKIKGLKFDGLNIALWALYLSNISNLLIDDIEIVKILNSVGTPCAGVSLQDNCHNIRVVNSLFNVSDYGIVLGSEKMRQLRDTKEHNTDIIIANNNFIIDWGSGIGVNCAIKNITIGNNNITVTGNGIGIKCGEGVNNPSQLHVEDVVIQGNTIYNPNKVGHAIRVSQNVYSVLIADNNINGFSEGLWLSGNVNLDPSVSRGADINFNNNKVRDALYGVYSYNNVSQPKVTINGNTFINVDTGIYGVFFWSPITNNRFINNVKAILLERAFFCNIIGNNISNTKKTAIEFTTAENGTSNTSPIISNNIIENVSIDEQGTYPAIAINNLRAIITGNYINNFDNKGNYIIACASSSNLKIVKNNIYRGATVGFIQVTGSGDLIADNIQLGNIG